MRVIRLLASAVFVVACSPGDTADTDTTTMTVGADTSAAAAASPAAAMSLESVAGKWNMRVMAMDSDSVLTTHVLTTSADPSGWSITQPTGEQVPMRNVVVAGDSVTAEAGGFSSGVRRGMRVRNLRASYRLQGDKLVGTTTARYETTGADSVRTFRLEGTRAQ